MPKAKWGDIDASDVDDFEGSGVTPYTGPNVPNGVYMFEVKVCRQTKSKNNNPQLMVVCELVPRDDRPEEKKYSGHPVVDFMPVLKNTQFRYAPFLQAIGVTGRDFVNNTVVDPNSAKGDITKIGKVEPVGQYVFASVKWGPDNNNVQRLSVTQWIPSDVDEADDADDTDEADAPF